jgi:hypothetical protein
LAELSLPGFDDEFIVSRHRLDPQFFHRAVGRSGKLDFSPSPARRRDKFGGSSGTAEDPDPIKPEPEELSTLESKFGSLPGECKPPQHW